MEGLVAFATQLLKVGVEADSHTINRAFKGARV